MHSSESNCDFCAKKIATFCAVLSKFSSKSVVDFRLFRFTDGVTCTDDSSISRFATLLELLFILLILNCSSLLISFKAKKNLVLKKAHQGHVNYFHDRLINPIYDFA
jgi:hypothetical protein